MSIVDHIINMITDGNNKTFVNLGQGAVLFQNADIMSHMRRMHIVNIKLNVYFPSDGATINFFPHRQKCVKNRSVKSHHKSPTTNFIQILQTKSKATTNCGSLETRLWLPLSEETSRKFLQKGYIANNILRSLLFVAVDSVTLTVILFQDWSILWLML